MIEKRDNYAIQAMQAKKLFLTYDQEDLIRRCHLAHDENYFYVKFLSQPYRICRKTGNTERKEQGKWIDGNSFHEVMTLLDWLCDSREDRYITGRWVNLVTQGPNFHTALQEQTADPDAQLFDRQLDAFCAACEALEGEKVSGADVSYAMELVDGLKVLVRLWRADEEFPAQLCIYWDANALQYLRYETTWYAQGLLIKRIKEHLPLVTERLILRPWQPEDAPALYEAAKDPDIGYPAGWPAHQSVEDSRQIIENVLSAPQTYAVCLKDNNLPIGSIGLKMGEQTDMTDRSDECELGYWIAKPYWGQGLIPEAARALIRYAFENLNMRAIWCGYYDGNEKSCRVQEKLGFVYHHTTKDVDVALLHEKRTGHASLLTRRQWEQHKHREKKDG